MHHLECENTQIACATGRRSWVRLHSHAKHTNQHPLRCIMTSLPKRACKIPGQEDCVSFINFLGHDSTTRQQVDEFLEHEMGTISSQNKKTWLPTVPFSPSLFNCIHHFLFPHFTQSPSPFSLVFFHWAAHNKCFSTFYTSFFFMSTIYFYSYLLIPLEVQSSFCSITCVSDRGTLWWKELI